MGISFVAKALKMEFVKSIWRFIWQQFLWNFIWMEFSYFFSEILFIHFQTFARCSCWMSVCFLARHLASLKSHTHTHTDTHCRALRHAHSRTSLWGALTFIILWMSGTYSSYTWYTWIVLTIRIAVCNLLTFSSQRGKWEWEAVCVGRRGTLHWHS